MMRFVVVAVAFVVVGACERAGVADDQMALPEHRDVRVHRLVSEYLACWDANNAGDWERYEECFEAEAEIKIPGLAPTHDLATAIANAKRSRETHPLAYAEPRLVLATDSGISSVIRLHGIAANPSVAVYVAHRIQFGSHDRVRYESTYFDAAMSEAGTSEPSWINWKGLKVLVPLDEPQLQENVFVVEQLERTWGEQGRERATPIPFVADNLVWSEAWLDRPLDRVTLQSHLRMLGTDVNKPEMNLRNLSYAGDYLAGEGTLRWSRFPDLPAIGYRDDRNHRRRVEVPFLGFFRVDNGKLVAVSLFWQSKSLMDQLGLPALNGPIHPLE